MGVFLQWCHRVDMALRFLCVSDIDQFKRLNNMIHVFHVVPAIVLPMDKIEDSILQGSIIGNVTEAASIVSGKVGGALHMNGVNQSVNFGMYSPVCFRFIEACPDGITWAMWLKLYEQPPTYPVRLILDTGGYHSRSIGYALVSNMNGRFTILYSNLTHRHQIRLKSGTLGNGHTWCSLCTHPEKELYIWMAADLGSQFSPSFATDAYVDRHFVLGAANNLVSHTHMTIDNLLIWYDFLSASAVWQLYLQGSDIWSQQSLGFDFVHRKKTRCGSYISVH